LLHPLPVGDPDRLLVVGARGPAAADGRIGRLSETHLYPAYLAIRDSGIFGDVAAWGTWGALVTTEAGAEFRPVCFANERYFVALGLAIRQGRGFGAGEDRRGAAPVAVVSHRFWRAALNADPAAVGSDIRVGQAIVRVVGIAPPGFRGLSLAEAPDLFLPLETVGDVVGSSINFFALPVNATTSSPTAWIRIAGRLASGASSVQVTERLGAMSFQFGGRPRSFRGRGAIELTPVTLAAIPEAVRPGMRQFARLLATTITLLLLIGSLTVGVLLLMRTEARRDEFALCLALGATPTRLGLGVVTEGLLLAVAGALLALPLGWWMFAAMRAYQLSGGVDLAHLEIPFDVRAYGAAFMAAVAAAAIIALVAAGVSRSTSVADALRTRSAGTPRIGRRRARATLVAAQLGVSLVLLAGAGLFVRSLLQALDLNTGYRTDLLATASLDLRPYGYTPERAAGFFDELRDRLRGNGAVSAASVMAWTGGSGGEVGVDGTRRQFPSLVNWNSVDQAYFSTMGLPILVGRDFSGLDRHGAPRVAIVSESLARQLSADALPLGIRIAEGHSKPGQPPDTVEVVGVVPDIITQVATLEPLAIYMPSAQVDPGPSRTVVIRAARDPDSAMREVLSTIRALDSGIAPPVIRTIDAALLRQMGPQRIGAAVLSALGFIAALLTFLGTYVLAASMAAARQKEMGIRAALGATGRQLGFRVMAEAGRLIGAGVAVGIVLAWLGADLIRGFLFRVEPFDPVTIAVVLAGLLGLALVVSLRPAWRAARVDLARVLRED
jgi:predicted permease